MKKFSATVAMAAVTALIVGCASVGPDWTSKGSGAFKKDDGKVFYGVGLASADIKDKALRRETADNRARADIQKVFDTYTSYLMKDYQGQDGQLIDRACKTFAAGHLSGVEIVDRYAEKDGTAYSLAKLNLETFQKAMDMAKDLSDAARAHIQKRSDTMFDNLEKEEQKRDAK